MEFEERISSSGKSYYINTITGETQWGYKNFFNTKIPLPKGYICLFSNREDLYKYIGNEYDDKVTSYYYSPSDSESESDWTPVVRGKQKPKKDKLPKEVFYTESQKIIKDSYKHLEEVRTQSSKNEICRRIDLFKNVAKLLKRTPESIIDESLEFLSGKAEVLPQIIIKYIKTTEHEELGENASLTAFSTISQMDRSFSSERSIRELCGLNMREEELSNAVKQLKHFTCGISLELIQEPVMTGCPNGHTSDKNSMKDLLENSTRLKRCPTCNVPIPSTVTVSTLMPNVFAKQIIEEFVDKYVNQRGEIWTEIKETCMKHQVEKKIKDEADRKDRQDFLDIQQRDYEFWESARTAEEIRNYLLNEERYTPAQIEGIPESVARSTRPSYMQAVAETIRIGRPRNPQYYN